MRLIGGAPAGSRSLRRIAIVVGGALTGVLACVGPGPIVDERIVDVREGALARVAVVPFWPVPSVPPDAGPKALSAVESADVVSRIVSEAFSDAGIETVPPSDLVIAFEGHGQVLPRQDAAANALMAARDFGATAVVLGRVLRYRERDGGAAGAIRAASVLFEVALHAAPGGELLYTGRFDQTQQALSANPLLARKYPGRGTRWLTAAELTRWGADEIVATLPEVMR